MAKREFRPMYVREVRRFLGRFEPDSRVVFLDIVSPTKDSSELPQSVGQLLDFLRQADDADPVFIDSPNGLFGVWGFISASPPTLVGGLTSDSIESN